MHKCAYCGKENEAELGACSRCGTPFQRQPLTQTQRASVPLGAGMLIQSAGMMLFRAASDEPTPRALAFFLVIVGTALLIWGGRRYAMAKGYPDWVGILSVLMCLGVLVLFLLPSRVHPVQQGSPDEQPQATAARPQDNAEA